MLNKDIFLFLIDGFEEIEAIATVDVLRRAQLSVKTVSLTGCKAVTGSHGITVESDLLFEQSDFHTAQMLVLPGGTTKFNEHSGVKKLIFDFATAGNYVAAICASPMVLGGLGLLQKKKATCYPGFEKYLDGAILETDKSVVQDANIVTGRGPGLTLDFALKLIEIVGGQDKCDAVAKALLLK